MDFFQFLDIFGTRPSRFGKRRDIPKTQRSRRLHLLLLAPKKRSGKPSFSSLHHHHRRRRDRQKTSYRESEKDDDRVSRTESRDPKSRDRRKDPKGARGRIPDMSSKEDLYFSDFKTSQKKIS